MKKIFKITINLTENQNIPKLKESMESIDYFLNEVKIPVRGLISNKLRKFHTIRELLQSIDNEFNHTIKSITKSEDSFILEIEYHGSDFSENIHVKDSKLFYNNSELTISRHMIDDEENHYLGGLDFAPKLVFTNPIVYNAEETTEMDNEKSLSEVLRGIIK